MAELDDIQLLREFARRRSDTTFAAVVTRYVDLVHSVALRQTGNPHAAEDITQAVFIILARKAGSLGLKTVLSGWLYRTARLTAANYLRAERRRAFREQEAYMQSLSNEPESDVWAQIAPLLDDALSKLAEKDQLAILLRFFENKSLAEVGVALGASEDAAKMRVNRALEKLRKLFGQRGVRLSVAAIAGAVAANSVQAAPMQLGVSVTAASLGKAAVSASAAALLKGALQQLFWLKWRTAVVVVLGVSLIGVGVIVQQPHRVQGSTSSKIVRLPVIGNIGNNRQRPVAGPAVMKFKLLGTAGVPFELTYSSGGQSKTVKGVLPDEVLFTADAFSTTIKVQGPGEFGFEHYRGDWLQTSYGQGRITNSRTVFIEAQAGGTGMSLKSTK